MKKIVVFLSLLLCGALLITGVFYHKDSICAEEPNLSFYMTKTYFQWVKGTPTSWQENEVTGNLELFYEQGELYGYPAGAMYTFQRNFATWRLFEVTYTVRDLNQEDGLALFHQLNNTNSELYGKRENYYHQAVEDTLETNGTISTFFGTNNGATGMSVYIQYQNGMLLFSAITQQ